MAKQAPKYYCDGICERCEKGKWFEKGQYYSCDPEKVNGITVVCPTPPLYYLKKRNKAAIKCEGRKSYGNCKCKQA